MSSNNDVGILAIEVYFPGTYVRQEDLEVANGVSKGKYTIGLGQDAMAFTGDLEDVNSIALSVVKSLMEKYDIAPESVGRLEIGTESLVDKSKSTKTVLMSLFAESGNTDIEGATVINACYGGTAALLNALAWADSSAWDGRYAIVVAADIAVYADGPARPTGGCGSVAMLIGRNAPLKIDLATRTTHATDVWDFFKPNMDSEYPEVNGALSQTCYLQALDDCYTRYVAKCKKVNDRDVAISDISYFLFHSPYNKLVQKSFARLVYQDMMAGRMDNSGIQKWLDVPVASTYEDRELETVLKGVAGPLYKQKVAVGCELSKQIGNTYTASVYMNVANLVSAIGSDLIGKNVTLFSYGSGALASMFSISPREVANSKFSLAEMQRQLDIPNRLSRRECLTPAELNFALQARERSHGVIPFKPTFNVDKLVPGSYYLEQIDAKYVRNYKRKPLEAGQVYGGALLGTFDDDDVGIDIDDDEDGADLNNSKDDLKDTSIVRNRTVVWASGRPNVKVVVTGVAAAVPGRNSAVFTPGVNNIQRIINGESFLTAIPTNVMDKMLEKNVVELKKGEDGNMIKSPVDSYEKTINVVAALGDINLTAYGVSKSIASTMDNAVQVSIAAGLEALKDAGIVSGIGEGTSGWVLPEHLQNTTGIVYATSFPALDTAIEEVSKFFLSKMATKEIITDVVANLRNRLEKSYGQLSSETESALVQLAKAAEEAKETDAKPYEFDRKFLFRVLVLGNSQLAQIIKARGPNMQTNAACAGSTQAVALAYDMIQVGRAERMIVIAGDSASSDTLMPWLGNGFRILGAATTCADIKLASIPFNEKRSGMILGSGGIGMVLESEDGARRRYYSQLASPTPGIVMRTTPFKCRLLGTLFTNSAYHGAAMDREHIAEEMERFIQSVEREQGISREEIAKSGVYFSHETSTHASPSSSCSANEVYGLRKVFGDNLKDLLILNTKGFTGHPMGVSFEDVVASEVLVTGMVPPIANLTTCDPALGTDLKLSTGGPYPCKYAMRFAAGFGSQIALALYGRAEL